MELTEKKVTSEVVFQGQILTVLRDTAELPNGKTAEREVVRHPGGVAVLPLDEDGNVLLVRQFRYPFGRVLLEIPAGKLDRGEEPLHAAARELEEETGVQAEELISLGSIYVSPGFCDEELHLYLAQGLKQGKSHPDEDEFLAPERVPCEVLTEQIMSGAIHDGKTVAAVLKAKLYLER